jgi:hypothetical protein
MIGNTQESGGRAEMAQTVYTNVSKCKNNKIKLKKERNLTKTTTKIPRRKLEL